MQWFGMLTTSLQRIFFRCTITSSKSRSLNGIFDREEPRCVALKLSVSIAKDAG